MVLFEAAHLLGIVPVLWLVGLHLTGQRRTWPWWVMAAGFGVSFVADFLSWPLAQQVYPLSQAALFGLVLLPSRRTVEGFVALLVFVATISILAREAAGMDVLLRVVAWLGVAGFAYGMLRPGPLRAVVSGGFLALTVSWLAYLVVPGWATYLTYQGTRLGMTGAWCVVARGADE